MSAEYEAPQGKPITPDQTRQYLTWMGLDPESSNSFAPENWTRAVIGALTFGIVGGTDTSAYAGLTTKEALARHRELADFIHAVTDSGRELTQK